MAPGAENRRRHRSIGLITGKIVLPDPVAHLPLGQTKFTGGPDLHPTVAPQGQFDLRALDILHFDAHPDLYEDLYGDRLSHACPFARILEDGLAGRLVQVGIRSMTPPQREQADRYGVEVVDMRSMREGLRPEPFGPGIPSSCMNLK